MAAFYREGDRVKMTEYALKQGLDCGIGKKYPCTTTGVVVSDQRGNLMMVLRDGRKHPSRYHAKFWVLDLAPASA